MFMRVCVCGSIFNDLIYFVKEVFSVKKRTGKVLKEAAINRSTMNSALKESLRPRASKSLIPAEPWST